MVARKFSRLIFAFVGLSFAVMSCKTAIPFQPFGVVDGVSRTPASTLTGPLAFSVDFDNPQDLELLGRCHWWNDDGCTISTNNELQWYVPAGVATRNGVLALTAREQTVRASDGETYGYSSGMISTGPSVYQGRSAFSFTYGYVEARAKIPSGKGLWPAVWLLPASGEALPEIDIIEFIGDAPGTAEMHAHRSAGGSAASAGGFFESADFSRDFHVYAIEWTPSHVAWFIDGVERFRVDGPFVPHEPMYVVANLAVGGNWPGSPDSDTAFPAEFLIDYVRIWQL